MKTHRFPIGTEFMSRGKHPRKCTVIDYRTTTDSRGEVVRISYVASHEFLGIPVVEEVTEMRVAMGLLQTAYGGHREVQS
jgi:hypothetical protein